MTAEVYDIYGDKLDAEGVPADYREAIAQMFEEMAVEAREGMIENFVAVLMRSENHYAVRCWHRDTIRLIGACEAAKFDIINHDEAVDPLEIDAG